MQLLAMTAPPAVGIMFDTSLSRVDDALALALLYGLDGKRELRVVAMSVSRSSIHAAAFCDAVGRFYAGEVSGAIGATGRTLPIGLATGSTLKEDLALFTAPLDRKNAAGKPAYVTDIQDVLDTADPVAVIRNAFTAQWDDNSVLVLSGAATSLARLLDVPSAKALAARKVRLLVFAGGAFPDGEPDANIKADIPAARKLFAEWPTPIVMAGRELGQSVLFPASSVEKDFAWSPAHPVVDAYRANQPMPYDAPTQTMAAVLYAGRPKDGYFKLSDAGNVTVLDDGRVKFTPSAVGKQRYLILDPAQKDRILKTYTEVASAKPVPPPPRRPRPPVQQPPPPAVPATPAQQQKPS